MVNYLYDRSAFAVPDTPLWEMFMYVLHGRMLSRFAEAEFQATPGGKTRERFAHSLFPQLEKMEADSKSRAMKRMDEWVGIGPILVKPQEGALDGPKPKPVPKMNVPFRLR